MLIIPTRHPGRRLSMPFERIVNLSRLERLVYGEGQLRQFQYHALGANWVNAVRRCRLGGQGISEDELVCRNKHPFADADEF